MLENDKQLKECTIKLCNELFDTLFDALKDDIEKRPSLELDCLAVASNYMLMSSGLSLYNDRTYFAYVRKTCELFGYKDIENKKVYKCAIGLRKLFKADHDFLHNDEFKLGFNILDVTSMQVRNALGADFRRLGETFMDYFDNDKITTDIGDFLKDEITRVLNTPSNEKLR